MSQWRWLAGLGAMWWLVAAQATDVWREPLTGLEFVRVPKACFSMGSPDSAFSSEDAAVNRRVRQTETPQHEACLDSFWIARTEVTREAWHQVMQGPSPLDNALRLPASGMTRAAAVDFARRLSQMNGAGRFRLPTEAEWEHACRGGRMPSFETFAYAWDLDKRAWFSSAYGMHPGKRLADVQPVGTRQPNGYGLYDMLGNVWEWVADDYRADAYRNHKLFNPQVTADNGLATIRGGSLRTDFRMLRCEVRGWLPTSEAMTSVGFRLVREEITQ